MPTVFTHAVVGGLAAAAVGDRGSRQRLCTAAAIVSVLPDLDVIGNHRYFMPWTPILVAPIGIVDFISPYGLKVMMFEIVNIWLPAAVAAGAVIAARRIRRGRNLTSSAGAE